MNTLNSEITEFTNQRREFLKVFTATARYYHRFDVFRDFVTLSAIALRNAIHKSDDLETEYMRIIGRYKDEDPKNMSRMLAITVNALEEGPSDFLGPLFMDLSFGDSHRGQFYTPASVSSMMAELQFADIGIKLKEQPFITVSEPTCGSGGMIMPIVEFMLREGHNPAHKLWVQAVDIDRTAALMSYIQFSLWNIPAEVIVGNTLSLKSSEVWKTPAYYLFGWHNKLKNAGIPEGFPEVPAQPS